MAQSSSSFLDMFRELAQGLSLPRVDADKLLEAHRKNIAALEQSAQVASEGAASVAAKQKEIIENVFREVTAMAQDLKSVDNPSTALTKQTEFAKKTFEAAVKNTQDIAELVRKSSADAQKVILDRMKASVEEFRASVAKSK